MSGSFSDIFLFISLQAVTYFDIATTIGDSEKTATELALQTGAQEDWIYRVLKMLSLEGYFEETSERTFRNTALSTAFRRDIPNSRYPMARFFGSSYLREALCQLEAVMRSGQPAAQVLGRPPIFEYFAQHPQESAIFENAISVPADLANDAIATAYDFSHKRVLDVGGGKGNLLKTIITNHDGVQGILFDLPAVIAQASESEPYEKLAGDCLKEVPGDADIILLRDVFHLLNDEQSALLCANLRRAMRKDTVVLVCEQLLASENANQALTAKIDLLMGVLFGGRQRNENGWRSLFAAAGFDWLQTIPTESPYSLLFFVLH